MGKRKQEQNDITDATISMKDIWKDVMYNTKRCAEIELLYEKEIELIKAEFGENIYKVIQNEIEDNKPTYINLYEKILIIDDPLKDRLILNEFDDEDKESYEQLMDLIKIRMKEIDEK